MKLRLNRILKSNRYSFWNYATKPFSTGFRGISDCGFICSTATATSTVVAATVLPATVVAATVVAATVVAATVVAATVVAAAAASPPA
jgi:hypothetical protein